MLEATSWAFPEVASSSFTLAEAHLELAGDDFQGHFLITLPSHTRHNHYLFLKTEVEWDEFPGGCNTQEH